MVGAVGKNDNDRSFVKEKEKVDSILNKSAIRKDFDEIQSIKH